MGYRSKVGKLRSLGGRLVTVRTMGSEVSGQKKQWSLSSNVNSTASSQKCLV